MFSVAGDGVNLREADTDPGWNEMSVYSAEYLNTCSSYDPGPGPGPGLSYCDEKVTIIKVYSLIPNILGASLP